MKVEDVLVGNPGVGWKKVTSAGDDESSVTFSKGEVLVRIVGVAHPSCDVASFDPRLVLVGSVISFGARPAGDDGRVARFAGELAGTASLAAVFDTKQFTFLVLGLGPPSGVDQLSADVQGIVDAQSARDGGLVASHPVAEATNRAALALLDDAPVAVFIGPVTASGSFVSCGGVANEALRYIGRHSEQGVAEFNGPDGAVVAIDLVHYPFELVAAGATGTKFSSTVAVGSAGAALPRGAVMYAQVDHPDQAMVVFRRERYGVIVTAQAHQGATALAAQFATAQAARLPGGPIGTYRFPTPAASIASAGALVLVLVCSLLLVRRLRAGTAQRCPAVAVSLGPGPLVVDVNARARAMRRRSKWLVVLQVILLVPVLVGLAADIGAARWLVATAGLAFAVVATLWVRQKDDGHTGPTGRRHRPLPSIAAGLAGLASVIVVVGAAALVVHGLQELAFAPSLAHLGLSDRLAVEPRRLAWAITGLGVVVVLGGVVAVRLSRSLARIGWRGARGDDAPVVYLRSFHDDQLTLPCAASSRRPWIEVLGLRAREPFEEAIAWELSSYGPVIAIGRPGRTRASLGAAREHLADDVWQQVIADRLAAARAVVVTIGSTDGLAWELGHLADAGHLEKTTFLVPPVLDADSASRWRFTSSALQHAGVPAHQSTLDAVATAAAITIQLDVNGGCVVHSADRRDEASYRAALDDAVGRQLPAR